METCLSTARIATLFYTRLDYLLFKVSQTSPNVEGRWIVSYVGIVVIVLLVYLFI